MAIEAILFDLDGTLVDNTGSVQEGILDLIHWIEAKDLYWAVASNRGQRRANHVLRAAGLEPHLVVTNDEVQAKKPSPAFCTYVTSQFDISLKELIYIGDNDRTDAICAINAKVLYFNAGWSNPESRYGWPLSYPKDLSFLIETFLLRDSLWYWKLDSEDSLTRPISARSLYNARSNWNRDLVKKAKNVLKEIEIIPDFRTMLFFFFLTSLYLDSLCYNVDWWTIYPGSGQVKPRRFLANFIEFATKLFRDQFKIDLLVRHTPSIKSAFARAKGVHPPFTNQTNTVHLNPLYRGRLEGKKILIIDDFRTESYSFECTRNLLLMGGAEKVICVSFGCYRTAYKVKVPKSVHAWDPWKPANLKENDFKTKILPGTVNERVLEDLVSALG